MKLFRVYEDNNGESPGDGGFFIPIKDLGYDVPHMCWIQRNPWWTYYRTGNPDGWNDEEIINANELKPELLRGLIKYIMSDFIEDMK